MTIVASGGGGPPPADAFPRHLLAGDTLLAARSLIGARLVRAAGPDAAGSGPANGPRIGRIVEVEAYVGPDDRASHARMGPTARNAPMFGPAGIAYVYLVYGVHHCLNVVTGEDGFPAAVLVRAVEPLEGFDAMRRARGDDGARGDDRAARPSRSSRPSRAPVPDHRLAAGPGLVGAAFGIDRSLTGIDLCDPRSPVHLAPAPVDEPAAEIAGTSRIGIAFAGTPWTEVPWRLVDTRSRSLSRPIRAGGGS
jgi:DNA-3-methyladenine glycosylase